MLDRAGFVRTSMVVVLVRAMEEPLREACLGSRYGLSGRVYLPRVHAGPGNKCTS